MKNILYKESIVEIKHVFRIMKAEFNLQMQQNSD